MKFVYRVAEITAQHLQLGVTAVLRDTDYRLLYQVQAKLGKVRVDTKYIPYCSVPAFCFSRVKL
jgi:hypothetical protein